MKNFATKADRNKAIKLLVDAKKHIKEEKEDWVCSAITLASHGGVYILTGRQKYAERIANRLRAEIRKRLEGCTFVDDWLYDKAGIKSRDLTSDRMKQYRMNWIDSMIAELEAM